jgi:hypothetical protein
MDAIAEQAVLAATCRCSAREQKLVNAVFGVVGRHWAISLASKPCVIVFLRDLNRERPSS